MRIRLTAIILTCLLLNACSTNQDRDSREEKDKTSTWKPINEAKKINCFIYHRFGDSRYPSTNVSLDNFNKHLNYLKEAGFEVLTFSESIKYLKDDTPEKKVAVITVDDAFKSFYENGLPMLEKYEFTATLFVNTKTVGGGSYMDWDELKDASRRGIEIGNHTHSHDYFLNLDQEIRYDQFESEIRICQDLILENLGIQTEIFAYPYGEFDPKMKKIVQGIGFTAAAAQNSGVINYATDLMACPRFPMATGFDDISGFKLKVNAHSLDLKGSPESHLVEKSRPLLTLELEAEGIRISEMRCFIQGNSCSISKQQHSENHYQINVEPARSIAGRRRTLYTLTAQDQSDQWYWYSYLWVNPEVPE